MNPWVRICVRLYRRLARAYPHEFRLICGDEMERLGEDAAPEVWRRYGFSGLARLLADIALRLPGEYLSELRQDLRYAFRRLRQAPGFTAVGVLSLAMGIGMAVMFFANIQMLILSPVPGTTDPDALVTLQRPVPYPYFESYRGHREIAVAATAFLSQVPFSVATEGAAQVAERVSGHLVSPEYFSTLGAVPAAGRFFQPETEKPGSEPVVVVSERFWRTRLHSDPQAVGRTLRVNGQSAKIIGIGPEGFRGIFPLPPADLFVPVTAGAAIAPELRDNALRNPDFERFRVVLRLADGVTVPAAEAALDVVTRTLDQQRPAADQEPKRGAARLLEAGPLFPMTPEQRTMMLSIYGLLLAMVLSLACANLASLLLARGNQRQREIAIRLSVGASRFRLVRQLLTESVILSLVGGVLGLALYAGLAAASESLSVTAELGWDRDTRPDLALVVFTLGAALAASVGFGLTPALASASTDVVTALKAGGLGRLRNYRRFGIRNMFVVYQVAVSLMLLLISGFIVVGYHRSTGADPGFDAANLSLFSLDPLRDGYSPEQSAKLLERVPERLSQLPQVRGITMTDRITFGEMMVMPNAHVSVPTMEGPAPAGERVEGPTVVGESKQALHDVVRQRVGANYFATLGVPVVLGREFTEQDLRAGQSSGAGPDTITPAVINQTAARELFGEADPIGGRISEDEETYVVVGVTQDTQAAAMMSKPVASIFLPLAAEAFEKASPQGVTFLVRGTASADSMAAVRREIESIDPALTIFNAHAMSEYLGRFRVMLQWSSVVNGSLGLFGLILSCIGLAAVTSHAVARRRKEIGIRMALGARSAQVLRLVLKEGAVLVVVGSVLGFLGATALARAVPSFIADLARIFAVGTNEPLLIVGGPLLLGSLALIACYLPARRSTKIDPLVALREE